MQPRTTGAVTGLMASRSATAGLSPRVNTSHRKCAPSLNLTSTMVTWLACPVDFIMTTPKRQFWTPELDNYLRANAPFLPSKQLAEKLHKSSSAVHARAKRLGVSMTKRGPEHWNAKASHELAHMVQVLADAGFPVVQIHALVTQPQNISYEAVNDIAAARTWRQR